MYGLTTRGRRLLGLAGRARTFRPGPALDLVLQTTEVYVELEAEGWEIIPAGARWAQHRALKRAQEAAIRRGDVRRVDVIDREQALRVSVDWLPFMDLLFHPGKEEARYVMVLTRATPRRKALLSLPGPERQRELARQNIVAGVEDAAADHDPSCDHGLLPAPADHVRAAGPPRAPTLSRRGPPGTGRAVLDPLFPRPGRDGHWLQPLRSVGRSGPPIQVGRPPLPVASRGPLLL